MDMSSIYTIGSSTHTTEEFHSLLKKYNINAVADIRSVPYSKYTPQFNKEILRSYLKSASIHYLDFSAEFGAKRKEKEVYTQDKVNFEKVRGLPQFLYGIERIHEGLQQGFTVVLMCTEKNPLECHRFSLVSKVLHEVLSIDIAHILFDGSIITQQELEQEMLRDLQLENDLFYDHTMLLEKAYTIISNKIACREGEDLV